MQDRNPETGDWLSTLLDGELDDDGARAALDRLGRDPRARTRWAEYCLIGDALRGELQVQPRLKRSLAAALEAEPTVLAPLPRPNRSRPAVWLAAAAAVGAITWTLWSAAPQDASPVPTAAGDGATNLAQEEVMPYLAAHQDYAQAVVATPDMQFTTVSLSQAGAGR